MIAGWMDGWTDGRTDGWMNRWMVRTTTCPLQVALWLLMLKHLRKLLPIVIVKKKYQILNSLQVSYITLSLSNMILSF